MNPEIRDTSPIDESLRRGLDPSARAVERVVLRALEERPERERSAPRWVAWLSAAAAVCLVVLAVWLAPRLQPPPTPEGAEARISMGNVGSIIVLETGRGGGTMLLSGTSADGDASWRGQIIIQRRERP